MTACLKIISQKTLYLWCLIMTIIIFLIWSNSIVQNIAFSIKSCCTYLYASCWGFIRFKEEGFSRWRAGTPIHTRAFVIEPLLSKDGYCAQFYIILLSIHDHHNFQVTVFDAMIFIKIFTVSMSSRKIWTGVMHLVLSLVMRVCGV